MDSAHGKINILCGGEKQVVLLRSEVSHHKTDLLTMVVEGTDKICHLVQGGIRSENASICHCGGQFQTTYYIVYFGGLVLT